MGAGRALVVTALVGCSGSSDWQTFPEVAATGIETRFEGGSEWTPTAQEAFEIRAACPRIERARAQRETETVWLVEIQGEGLDRIAQVGAVLDGGKLAAARHRDRPDGSMAFPVACSSCTVVLGFDMGQGRLAACTGPAFSLVFGPEGIVASR